MARKDRINEKGFFPADSDDWHSMTGEWLWMLPTSQGTYIVDNNPLYVYGISFKDEVSCFRHADGTLHFDHVINGGGHSNYRIFLRPGKSKADFLKRWSALEELGCSYESSADPEDVFGIDVPPETDVYLVYDILAQGQSDDVWDLDEGNFEHVKRTSLQ